LRGNKFGTRIKMGDGPNLN